MVSGRVAPTTIALGPAAIPSGATAIVARQGEPASQHLLIYEIVGSATLHHVDLSRSIKSELFSPAWVTRWNKLTRRFRYMIAASHNAANLLLLVVLVTPISVGRTIAVAIIPLGLPGCIATLLSLRYDMMYVIVRTYDFWFFWTVTLATCVCLGVFVNDVRATAGFFTAIGTLISIVIDASISMTKVFSFTSAVGGVVSLFVVAAVHLDLVPGANDLKITVNTRSVSLSDIIANNILTLAILLARNAYRRKQAVRHTASDQSSIRCITYRCPVKLQLMASAVPVVERPTRRSSNNHRTSTVPRLMSHQHASPSFRTSELRLVPIDEKIDGYRCLVGNYGAMKPWPWLLRVGMWTTAVVSIAVTAALLLYELLFDSRPGRIAPSHGVYTAVFVVSIVSCSSMAAFLQPQLLRRLVGSFDWAFISLQFTHLHVCVCDIFNWDKRALLMLTAHCWIHLILTADALAPHMRKCIGFHRAFAIFVVTTYASGACLFIGKLVLDPKWDLYDRVLLDTTVAGHRVLVRVVPMIFGRTPMAIIWAFRLVWRLYTSQDGELSLILGAVAYDRRNPK
jgi:hypothetical protein